MIKRLISFLAALFFLGVCFSQAYAFNFYEGELNAESVYMLDYDNGVSLVEKNVEAKRYPASLTKIVTFLIAYENSSERGQTKLPVTKEILDLVDPESSGATFKEGEEYTITDLLNCMMISSSGYAAVTLAYHIGGGDVGKFVEMMNEKVSQLGCENTHFVNPDGIHDNDQYTTALDMYKIVKYAMQNQEFLEIVGKTEYKMFGDARDPIVTTNHLMNKKRGGKYYLPYVKGIKTGYTRQAGRCLISYAVKGGKTYLAIVMGGPSESPSGEVLPENTAMVDSVNLYNWVFSDLKVMNLCEKYYPLAQSDLRLVWGRDKLALSAEKDVSVCLPRSVNREDISFEYEIPEQVTAPVKENEVIGKANVIYGGERLFSFNLVSTESFEPNYLLLVFSFLNSVFTSKIFMFLMIILLALLAFYILLLFRYNRRKKRKNKVVKIGKYKK